MSIGSTWEKLYGAVWLLASSDGTLQQRLSRAYAQMATLTSDDFPDDELWEDYKILVYALRPGVPGGTEGRVPASPGVWYREQADKSVEMFLHLYTEITRLEERLYRDLPLRPKPGTETRAGGDA